MPGHNPYYVPPEVPLPFHQYHRTTRVLRADSTTSSFGGATTPTSARINDGHVFAAGAQHAGHGGQRGGAWPYVGLWGPEGGASARSPSATPLRGSTFNVEVIKYNELSIGRLLGEGAGRCLTV